jgi:predicted RNase H-like HicB family nuclease
MTFNVKIWKGEGGYFVAQCEELPGCITQGKTLEEARRNVREALELYLEEALTKGEPVGPEPNVPVERVRFELAPA